MQRIVRANFSTVFRRFLSLEARKLKRRALRDRGAIPDADVRSALDSILRVNQAGELGARWIYAGQLAILKNTTSGPIIEHMAEQELEHLEAFNRLLVQYGARPSALEPLWTKLGFALGAGTALLGSQAAMACTVAVETVIGGHYNDQLRKLHELEEKGQFKDDELRECIRKFRDDELEHLNIGLDNDAEKTPGYESMQSIIKTLTKVVIEVAKRV